MNLITIIGIIIILALLIAVLGFIKARRNREECHNSLSREELKTALNEMGISFPGNIGDEKLQAKYDEAVAAKAAADAANPPGTSPGEAPAGEPGKVTGAGPAAVDSIVPASAEELAKAKAAAEAAPAAPGDDAIQELEILEKIKAGLTREQAVEVITTQRAHDKQLAAQG